MISAEIFSTSDSLAVKVISAKPVPAILHHFFCRAVRAALKNIDLSDLTNSVSQSVRTISDSDFQAVRIASSACRSHNQSQKDEVASVVQQVRIDEKLLYTETDFSKHTC